MFEFLRLKKREATDVNQYQNIINSINLIRVERMHRVFSSDMSTIKIRVSYLSIQEYNQYIKLVSDELQQDKPMSSGLFMNSQRQIYLRDWFVDSSGYYLHPEEHAIIFKERASKFVGVYMEQDKSCMKEDVRRNLLHTGPIVNQIRDLTNLFIKVSSFDSIESSVVDPRRL